MKSYDKEMYVQNMHLNPATRVQNERKHSNIAACKTYEENVVGNVLDVGSDNGTHTILVAEFDGVNQITGLTLSAEGVQASFDTLEFIHPKYRQKLNFIEGNACDMNMIEAAFIGELYRVLKPGRSLILSIPYERAHDCENHVTYWNEKSLSELMTKHGFTVEDVHQGIGQSLNGRFTK